MWTKLLFIILGLAVVGLVTFVFVERTRLDQKNAAVVDELLAAAEASSSPTVQPSDWTDLPAPIQRYLAHVLPKEPPSIQVARLQQKGTFRSGDASADWSPFTATEIVTTRPAGFLWEASIEMVPLVPVRVPLDGEVAWVHPEGEASYWRGHMEAIEYLHDGPDSSPEASTLLRGRGA